MGLTCPHGRRGACAARQLILNHVDADVDLSSAGTRRRRRRCLQARQWLGLSSQVLAFKAWMLSLAGRGLDGRCVAVVQAGPGHAPGAG